MSVPVTVEFPVPVTSKKQGKSKSLPFNELRKDPVEAYQGIILNFGKHTGKQLKDVAVEDPKYLQWLKKRFNENQDNLSPTQNAICKFCETI